MNTVCYCCTGEREVAFIVLLQFLETFLLKWDVQRQQQETQLYGLCCASETRSTRRRYIASLCGYNLSMCLHIMIALELAEDTFPQVPFFLAQLLQWPKKQKRLRGSVRNQRRVILDLVIFPSSASSHRILSAARTLFVNQLMLGLDVLQHCFHSCLQLELGLARQCHMQCVVTWSGPKRLLHDRKIDSLQHLQHPLCMLMGCLARLEKKKLMLLDHGCLNKPNFDELETLQKKCQMVLWFVIAQVTWIGRGHPIRTDPSSSSVQGGLCSRYSCCGNWGQEPGRQAWKIWRVHGR